MVLSKPTISFLFSVHIPKYYFKEAKKVEEYSVVFEKCFGQTLIPLRLTNEDSKDWINWLNKTFPIFIIIF